jgi:hypothetical protein
VGVSTFWTIWLTIVGLAALWLAIGMLSWLWRTLRGGG